MGIDSRLILIVERDEVVRELQKHFLEVAGFVVKFADDGEAAQSARGHVPALIVTEILIPKIDGLALCRRLRADELTADVPIVVFSILNAATRATEAGAQAFLRKPIVESTFIETIRALVAPQSSATMEQLRWASQ